MHMQINSHVMLVYDLYLFKNVKICLNKKANTTKVISRILGLFQNFTLLV